MTEEINYVLKPTQPYFIYDTFNIQQENYLKDGISHFYQFNTIKNISPRVVPDACIDMIFEYDPERPGHMHSYVAGTKLEYMIDPRLFHKEVFGVRFMPGNHPEMLKATMKDLLNKRLNTEDVLYGNKEWLNLMAQEKNFKERIKIFIEYYTKFEKKKTRLFGKNELLQAVKKMVYESSGKIKIHDLEDRTGYTERYINKVFIEEMGFSPKVFCKIIQFQKALEILNSGRPENMMKTSIELGYYDQSQFIHDFTKFCGITPLKYLKMRESRELLSGFFFYSSQPLQTSHQPVAPDTSSSSDGVSFTEVNEFPPAG